MPRNIVLIHSDQHRFDCLGVNGHPLLRTPRLDQLAGEGVNFTHAFTPSAICTPARASLMTGCWPSRHHCRGIPGIETYQPADPELPVFPRLLRDAGYTLGFVGKYHQELAGPPTDHGFDEFVGRRQYRQWRANQGLPPERGRRGYLNYFGNVDEGVAPEQSGLAWGADHAIRMIEQAAAGDGGAGTVAGGRPFFVRWDPYEPHLPCLPPEPYASMYDPADIPPWPSFADALEDKPWIQREQRRNWRVEGWGWERWAPTVAYYLGVISLLDAQVGRVLDVLDRLGLASRTLVIYTTDHGDLCGGHGMMDKHYVMYDDVQRVPLIVRCPDLLPSGGRGATCDAFVSHELDLAATFCDAAGLPAPDTFEGRSLLPIGRGEDPQPRQDIFAQYHGAQFGLYTQRMVRDRRWKYVWNATAPDELYDLASDPGELRNRASDPAAAEELDRLRRRLVAWMESIDDPMCNNWTRSRLVSEPSPGEALTE